MRVSKNVSLRLSISDYNLLQKLADESGLHKSEFLRLMIKVIGITTKMSTATKFEENIVENEYGWNIPKDFMETFIQDLTTGLNRVNKTPIRMAKSKKNVPTRQHLSQIA